MFKIKKITAENFFSYDKIELSFRKEGGALIRSQSPNGTGVNTENSNGMGKSSVLEAVSFALYGKTLRDTKNYIKRGTKWCMAGVDLFDRQSNQKLKIKRYRNHPTHKNNLYIYLDGEELSLENTNKESQIRINNFLGDFKSFEVRSISPELANFMALSPNQKTERLLNYFGVDFTTMYNRALQGCKDADDKKNVALIEYEKCSGEFKEIGARIASHEEYKETHEETKAELQKINDTLRKKVDKIKEVYDSSGGPTIADEIEEKKEEALKAERDCRKKVRVKAQTTRDLEKHDEAHSESVCPTCYQEVDRTLLGEKRKSLEEAEKLAAKEEKKALAKKRKAEDALDELEERKKKLDTLKLEGKAIVAKIKQNKNTMKKLTLMSGNIDTELVRHKELGDELKAREAQIEDLTLDSLVWAEWKRQLGARGVKPIFLKDFLGALNERVNYFLRILFPLSPVHLEFGVDGDSISYTLTGKEYSNASNGERKRINVAVALGMAELKKTGASCLGFRFLDEVMDSLDPAGVSAVLDILKESSDTQTFVVSHNPTFEEELLQRIQNLCIIGVSKDEDGISKAEIH